MGKNLKKTVKTDAKMMFYNRDPDDWVNYNETINVLLFENDKYLIKNNIHTSSDDDKILYHSIQIKRVYKTTNGKWRYSGEKLNIPLMAFKEFISRLSQLDVETLSDLKSE